MAIQRGLAAAAPSAGAPINLRMTVADTGIGLSAKVRASLFTRYSSAGGVGLGLYLTQKLVRHLGSEIDVASPWEAGRSGTRFRFCVPMTVASPPAATSHDRDDEGKGGGKDDGSFLSGVQLRVLIADDLKLNRMLLLRSIQRCLGPEWRFEQASFAEEALELATATHFDLIIVDENFGAEDALRGSDVIAKYRAHETAQLASGQRSARAKIISCTGNAEEITPMLLDKGADVVWGKPCPNPGDGSLQLALRQLLARAA